ncbi:MAG TPA: TusE/DsrC/DsvC family sulfur relay protein [Gammaproteobacteria bacterium]|nr:Dissimilatory sulfite reductase, gamma subunit [Beggiatoa sp. SS]MEC4583602.1 TusE/DsrC/DsvC family sulfur relay protein [Candidatus Parabeggiatoa sp.]HAI68039.1 TusE/DsrC/DsvC family sulfur relay protein [Gammaproteobacteria bacterium]
MELEINGKSIETDSQGYLVNLSDWNEELANVLAQQNDLPLTEGHWEIINMIRTYYHDHGTAPAMRALIKLVKEELGSDKGNSKYLYSLFPYGPGKQAARYAGLPKPTGCV